MALCRRWTWFLHCITSVQRDSFGGNGRRRFQLFLVDIGAVPTRKAGCQRLVPFKPKKEIEPQLSGPQVRRQDIFCHERESVRSLGQKVPHQC